MKTTNINLKKNLLKTFVFNVTFVYIFLEVNLGQWENINNEKSRCSVTVIF